MSLFLATLLTSLLLLIAGAAFLFKQSLTEKLLKTFLRSNVATYIFFSSAALIFLWQITQLGEADFGQYRNWLFTLFAAVGLGSFFYVKDLLSVRGLAILTFFTCNTFLQAAYMQEPQSRLFLVSLLYLFIIIALIIGTAPFYFRDFFAWLFKKQARVKILGNVLLTYGMLLTGVALSY